MSESPLMNGGAGRAWNADERTLIERALEERLLMEWRAGRRSALAAAMTQYPELAEDLAAFALEIEPWVDAVGATHDADVGRPGLSHGARMALQQLFGDDGVVERGVDGDERQRERRIAETRQGYTTRRADDSITRPDPDNE